MDRDPINLGQIPTVELHRHWEAGIAPETLAKLAERNRITKLRKADGQPLEGVDPQDPESIRGYIQRVVDGLQHDGADAMSQFLIAFRALNTVIRTGDDVAESVYSQLAAEQEAGSLHTELRGSPLSVTQRSGIPINEVIQAVEVGIELAWTQLRMSATQIVCFSREKGLTDPTDLFKYQAPEVVAAVMQQHRAAHPIGLDIAGNGEMQFPPRLFHEVFAPAREAEVPITVHAGEQGEPPHLENAPPSLIREAIQLGARRIGHGTSAIADAALMQELKDANIGIETCPVSNALMGFMLMQKHPLKAFLQKELLATACTDDPIFFGIASVRAMLAAHAEALRLSRSDLWTLARNGIETAFVSEKRRAHLHQALADCGVGA